MAQISLLLFYAELSVSRKSIGAGLVSKHEYTGNIKPTRRGQSSSGARNLVSKEHAP